MSTTNDLPARLREQADRHDAHARYAPHSGRAQWAQDLRDAAAEIERLRKAVLPEDD